MTPADDPTRPPGRSDDELLRRVHQRAAALRSRRRGGSVAAAAVVLAVVGVMGLTQVGRDDDRLVRTASGPPTSASHAVATTTMSSPEPTTAPGPSTTVEASPPMTTTPAPPPTVSPCRNSTDPACGPFYFDPPPDPDQPMTVEVIPSVATARVGEPMSFHIIRRDADGVSDGLRSYDVGDDSLTAMYARGRCDRYGPQDPPAKGLTPTVVTDDFPHTYTRAGTFTVRFSYAEGGSCQDSRTGGWDRPYASSGEGSVVLTVLP